MSQDGAMTSIISNSKRRRGLGIVTPNACTECRKKRAKCDGKIPCARCSTQGVECIYEIPVRQSKENMRLEIENLRNSQKQHERIFRALVSDDTSEQVLESLRNGKIPETIVDQLDGTPISSIAQSSEATAAFARMSDQQATEGALSGVRSMESSPGSAMASSDASAGSGMQYHRLTWRPECIARFNPHFQEHYDNTQQENVMKWKSDAVDSHALIETWHQQPRSNSIPDSTTQMARSKGQETLLGRQFGMEEPTQAHRDYSSNINQSWTTVTDNGAFVEHLMTLYFCWEYPIFASLSKEHFLEDFRTGNERHCSFLLVNALLALGCRFSNQANARTDPFNPNTAGDHFFAEALKILHAQTDKHLLTTIQALGLMSIREAGCGRTSLSLFYSGQSIRLAIEMGLHLESDAGYGQEMNAENAVRSATFWGAFSLDQAWNLNIGRLSHFSRDTKLVAKPAMIEEIEASAWIPYTDDGIDTNDPILTCLFTDHGHPPGAHLGRSCSQPSNIRTVYKTFCEFSEIVHRSMYVLYAPGAKVTSQQLIESYTEHLRWYEAIPTALRLGQNFTSAVLFAQYTLSRTSPLLPLTISSMYYHFAILLLFRPFIKLSIPSSSVAPLAITLQAADAISTLVKSYSKLYTLRRTPTFVPYIVLTSCIIHVFALGNDLGGLTALQQGVEDLKEMASCHGFATKALHILEFLLKHWEIEARIDFHSSDIKLEAGEEPNKPSSTSLNQFSPNIDGGVSISALRGGDNPLFCCFPLQGRPLLDVRKKELEEAGFKILG